MARRSFCLLWKNARKGHRTTILGPRQLPTTHRNDSIFRAKTKLHPSKSSTCRVRGATRRLVLLFGLPRLPIEDSRHRLGFACQRQMFSCPLARGLGLIGCEATASGRTPTEHLPLASAYSFACRRQMFACPSARGLELIGCEATASGRTPTDHLPLASAYSFACQRQMFSCPSARGLGLIGCEATASGRTPTEHLPLASNDRCGSRSGGKMTLAVAAAGAWGRVGP